MTIPGNIFQDQNPEMELNKLEINTTSGSSPRGVYEIPVFDGSEVSDSPTSSSSSSSGSGSGEKILSSSSPSKGGGAATPLFNPLNYGVQLKGFIDSMKKKSGVKRFSTSTINMLSNSYDVSAKSLRKTLGRIRSSEDSMGCCILPNAKPSWRNFKYSELSAATDHFSPERLLGKGGHAEVYKGCLPDGTIVAVKRLKKKGEKEDEERTADFLSELGIIAHVDHPNTAKLIGFGVEGGLYLVLQFAPRGSVESCLQGSEVMDWETRLRVALGVAEGLSYLHRTCQRRIIHRDIKASNILLTEDYEPLISDFGLAKWLPENWIHHVVYPIEGTFGYLAPEYFMHGIADEKSDVFAYGVLLLEILTGRRAVAGDSSRQSLVMWAKPFLDSSNIKAIADPKLEDNYNAEEMKRVMMIASMCIHHTPSKRPFMDEVVELLKGKPGTVVEEIRQKSITPRSVMLDAFDMEDYTNSNYLQDLNRHKELVME